MLIKRNNKRLMTGNKNQKKITPTLITIQRNKNFEKLFIDLNPKNEAIAPSKDP